MPECYIDSTLVGLLLDTDVSHKHSCNEVAKAMEKGPYKNEFAVGIIDNDKRKIRYIESFEEIGRTENLTFLKHRVKHHYMIKVAKEGKAMESFIITNVEAIGMKMEDFGLPSDLHELMKLTKDSVTTLNNPKILKLFKTLRQSPEVIKLQGVLYYLAKNRYNVDIDEVKGIISRGAD